MQHRQVQKVWIDENEDHVTLNIVYANLEATSQLNI